MRRLKRIGAFLLAIVIMVCCIPSNDAKATIFYGTDDTNSLTLTGGNENGIYVSTTTQLPIDENWEKRAYAVEDGTSGVYVNGELKSGVPLIRPSETAYYFGLADVGVAATRGTQVQIQGEFYYEDYVVEFVPVTYIFDGQSWSVPEEEGISFPSLNENTHIDENDGNWLICLNDSHGVFEMEDGESFLWNATLNGTSIEVTIIRNNGVFQLVLPETLIPIDGTANATLVLKAGKYVSNKNTTVSLIMDTILCFNKYGLAMHAPIAPDSSGVKFEVYQESNLNTQTSIYLKPSKEDIFEMASGDTRPLAASGYNAETGAYYYTNKNGITIGNTYYQPNVDRSTSLEFVKHNWISGTNYFIGMTTLGNATELIVDGTKLVLKGLFVYSGKLVEYKPMVLQWDSASTKWNDITKFEMDFKLTAITEKTSVCEMFISDDANVATKYQSITLDNITLTRQALDASGWDVYLTPSSTLENGYDVEMTGLYVSVKAGDTIVTSEAKLFYAEHEGGTLFLHLGIAQLPLDITENTEITLHAGNATASDGGRGVTLTKDVILTVNSDEEWSFTEHDGTEWKIFMNIDGAFESVSDEMFLWPVILNNRESKVVVQKEEENIVITIPSSQVPTDGSEDVTLTLKQDTVWGNKESVVRLSEDISLYFNKYGLSINEAIAPDTKNLIMAVVYHEGSTSQQKIYLDAFKEDAFPTTKDWDIRPVAANGFYDGIYYHSNNGIFINGTQSECEFIKVDVWDAYNDYYIGLGSTEINDGTEVLLKGLYIWDGKLVEYAPMYLKWSGNTDTGKWDVFAEETYVPGDANGDGNADACDILRVKKYLAKHEDTYKIPIYETGTDMIKDEIIDATDLKEIKLELIEAAKIELAAYCGPRREGYRYWDGEYGAHPDDPAGGWDSFITEQAFQDYIDCGFTYMFPEIDAAYDRAHKDGQMQSVSSFKESDLYLFMEIAEKMRIPVVAYSDYLTSLVGETSLVMSENHKATLSQMIKDLSTYTMFKGLTLRDEPRIESVSACTAVKDYLDELNPNLYYFTACLPIYCNELSYLTTKDTDSKEEAYQDYIDAFSDAHDTFAYNNYPLWYDPNKNITSVDNVWLQNLRLVAESAKAKGYDAAIALQSCAFGAKDGQSTEKHRREIKTKADIGFQVYSSMAYGMKNITYYTYWQHWIENDEGMHYTAMINYPNEKGGEPVKTNAYYAVKDVNMEIKKFDHVYMNFDWEGTMAVIPEGETASTMVSHVGDYTNSRIDSATSTEEAIIGCMKSIDGNDGYMVVNVTDPALELTNTVTIKFQDATKVLAYIHGNEQEIALNDGMCTVELAAGEGVFIIPIQ